MSVDDEHTVAYAGRLFDRSIVGDERNSHR